MRKLTRMFAILAFSALAFAACGGSDDESGSGGSQSAATPVDRAFAQEMIPHHKSAVEMAKIAQERGKSEFVKKLADDIVSSQSAEIEQLTAAEKRLAAEGVKVGKLDTGMSMGMSMGTEADPEALRTAEPFDEAFVKMMLPHHESAVMMAKAELADGRDQELRSLAEEIITAQEREIEQMRAFLTERGAAVPEGMSGM